MLHISSRLVLQCILVRTNITAVGQTTSALSRVHYLRLIDIQILNTSSNPLLDLVSRWRHDILLVSSVLKFVPGHARIPLYQVDNPSEHD